MSRGTGHYFPYDTIPGGFMLVTDAPDAAALEVQGLGGRGDILRLAR